MDLLWNCNFYNRKVQIRIIGLPGFITLILLVMKSGHLLIEIIFWDQNLYSFLRNFLEWNLWKLDFNWTGEKKPVESFRAIVVAT